MRRITFFSFCAVLTIDKQYNTSGKYYSRRIATFITSQTRTKGKKRVIL